MSLKRTAKPEQRYRLPRTAQSANDRQPALRIPETLQLSPGLNLFVSSDRLHATPNLAPARCRVRVRACGTRRHGGGGCGAGRRHGSTLWWSGDRISGSTSTTIRSRSSSASSKATWSSSRIGSFPDSVYASTPRAPGLTSSRRVALVGRSGSPWDDTGMSHPTRPERPGAHSPVGQVSSQALTRSSQSSGGFPRSSMRENTAQGAFLLPAARSVSWSLAHA